MNNFQFQLGVPFKKGMEWKICSRGNNASTNVFVLRQVDDPVTYISYSWVWEKNIPKFILEWDDV